MLSAKRNAIGAPRKRSDPPSAADHVDRAIGVAHHTRGVRTKQKVRHGRTVRTDHDLVRFDLLGDLEHLLVDRAGMRA